MSIKNILEAIIIVRFVFVNFNSLGFKIPNKEYNRHFVVTQG